MNRARTSAFIGIMILFFVMMTAPVSAGPVMSTQKAYDLVVDEVLQRNIEGISIFLSPKPLLAQTVVKTYTGKLFTVMESSWLVFIDDAPGANWSHPCRYVLINEQSGEIHVRSSDRPPTSLASMVRFHGPDPFAGDNRRSGDEKGSLKQPSRSPERLWAVIISGGAGSGSNYPRYWNDCSEMYKALSTVYGYPDEHIFVAIADGTNPAADQTTGTSSPLDLDGDGDPDITHAATVASLNSIFSQLAGTLGSMDTLFIYATDHGSGQSSAGQPTSMNLWNSEIIWDYEFADLLEPIQCREILVTLEPCFSGGFVNDVVDMTSTVPRVISTAANDHEYSWAMPPDYVYDTYVFHWTAAVRGVDAYGIPVDADVNNDEEVDMLEAYQYALAMDQDNEHPQYGEWPAGYGMTVTLAGSGPTSEGEVSLTRSMYRCEDQLRIIVEDLDLQGQGSVSITVTSTTDGTGETVTLPETDTAHFEGFLAISDSAARLADEKLLVAHADTITATYDDADFGGTGPKTVTDTATVDCEAPAILSLTVHSITYRSAVISWQTDTPATGKLMYGLVFSPTTAVENRVLGTYHEFLLDNLDSCEYYCFMVSSTDEAGNTTTDTHNGTLYYFRTHEQITAFSESLDANPSWPIVTGFNGWAWGVPDGNAGDPTSGYTGSNVYGYNLHGAYFNNIQQQQTLSTPPIDCSSFATVFFSFERWLGVESDSWDHATIQVSADDLSWTTIWENGSETIQDTAWTYQEFNLTSLVAGKSQVIIRWTMGPTDTSDTYSGWNIDDVRVFTTAPCTRAVPAIPPSGLLILGALFSVLLLSRANSRRQQQRE